MFWGRLFSVFSLGLLLAGCGRYQVRQLKPVKRERAHFVQTKAGVETRVRLLKKYDQCEIFNGRSISRRSSAVAYAVTIVNTTGKPVILSASNVGLKLFSGDDAYKLLMCNYYASLRARGISSDVAIFCTAFASVELVSAFLIGFSLPVLLIDAAIFGTLSSASIAVAHGRGMAAREAAFNELLRTDILRKMLKKLVVKPHDSATTLLFSPAKQSSFMIILQGADGQTKIPFNVDLNEK